MGLDKKAMFEKLLEQIKWQDDREVFSDALIEKVEVHTKSKRWDLFGNKRYLAVSNICKT